MPRTAQITIRFAELNGRPTSKKIKAGTTVAELAEDLDTRVSELFVNGAKGVGTYVLQADDFVAITTRISGGN